MTFFEVGQTRSDCIISVLVVMVMVMVVVAIVVAISVDSHTAAQMHTSLPQSLSIMAMITPHAPTIAHTCRPLKRKHPLLAPHTYTDTRSYTYSRIYIYT